MIFSQNICGSFMSQGINSDIAAMISSWILDESAWKIGYDLIPNAMPQVMMKFISTQILF
ncbi:MAG: hypothetical protein ACI8ZF_000785 [Candidatus Midichloriaceae bacterium]|jgi:hypothetical protein